MQPLGEGQALRPGGRAGRRTAAGLLLFPNLEKRPSSPSGTRWKAPEGLLPLTLRSLMLSAPQAAPGGVAAAWRWDFPGSPGSKQGALVPPAPGTKSPRVSELHPTTWPSRPSHRGSEEPESTWQLLGPLPASPGPSWTSLCTPVPSAAFHPGEVSEGLKTWLPRHHPFSPGPQPAAPRTPGLAEKLLGAMETWVTLQDLKHRVDLGSLARSPSPTGQRRCAWRGARRWRALGNASRGRKGRGPDGRQGAACMRT